MDLFGEPSRDPKQSQLFTPMWLARRMAERVPRTACVLEPSAGSGNLIAALVERGHPLDLIVAVERDPRWVEFLRERFPGLCVFCADFMSWSTSVQFGVALMNPPYEGNQHMRFIAHALEMSRRVWGVFPVSVEFSQERDDELWSQRAKIRHRVVLPERVKFGSSSGQIDCEVLDIEPRPEPRRADELRAVTEETWRP